MFDDDFGGYDDFDEFNDPDATQCAEGDYNAWEEEQVFQDQAADDAYLSYGYLNDDPEWHFGPDAFCYRCDAIGEVIGKSYGSIKVLHCTECDAEWEAIPDVEDLSGE